MPKVKVPVEDYQTPVDSGDLDGKQLFLFRLPSNVRLQDLDGVRMALPSKSSSSSKLCSVNGSSVGRYTLHSADTAESSAIRAVVTSSNAAEGSEAVLTVAPKFKRHIVLRRDVLPSAATVAPLPSAEQLAALPGVTLAYTVKTPPHTFVNFVPAGASLPGNKKTAATSAWKRSHDETPSTESSSPKKEKKKKKGQ